jgi:hypothetical protein
MPNKDTRVGTFRKCRDVRFESQMRIKADVPPNLNFMDSRPKELAATQTLVGGLSYARDREFPRRFPIKANRG